MLSESRVLPAFCLLTTFLASGGVINGWGPLHSNLVASTALGEGQLQLANDLAGIALSVGSLIFGVMIDHCGVRAVAALGLALAALGYALLALSDGAVLVTAGFSLVTGGGIAPYLATMALANMAGSDAEEQRGRRSRAAMLVSLNSACFNLAGFNFSVLNWLPAASPAAARRAFFLGYCALALALGAGALLLLPRPHRPAASSGGAGSGEGGEGSGKGGSEQPLLAGCAPAEAAGSAPAAATTTLWAEARAAPLAATALFFGVSQLVGTWLGGALPDLVAQKGRAEGVPPSTYEGVYVDYLLPALTSAPALLLNPLAGAFVARHSFGVAFALANTLALATVALALLPLEAQVATFFVSTARNAVFFTAFFTFLSEGTRAPHYGSLVAVCTGVAAVLGFAVVRALPSARHDKKYFLVYFCVLTRLLVSTCCVANHQVPIIALAGKHYNPVLWACVATLLLCYAQPAVLLLRSEVGEEGAAAAAGKVKVKPR
jgi:predicted MFS family arabinose efflux permease